MSFGQIIDTLPKNGGNLIIQVSHENKSSYFPLYWLFNRDPYNSLL